jgi:hypothetical protein
MGAWLWSAWLQVWPNLAANVVWIPIVGAGHLLMKRHVAAVLAQRAEEHRQQLADHAADLREQLTAHITTTIATAKETAP